jgi:hypothetical protein
VVTFGCFDLGRASNVALADRAAVSVRLRRLGQLTEAITQRYAGIHVNFLDHPEFSDALMSNDGIHLNRRGHALILAEVLRALRQRREPVR